MVNTDPFSAFNHPLQPWALKLHVVASPLLIFGVGSIFKDHVLAKARNGSSRRVKGIGLVTLFLFAGMALSGYLLQVISGDAGRWWTAWTHIVLGCAFLCAYAAHLASVAGRLAAIQRARRGDPASLLAAPRQGEGAVFQRLRRS